MLQGTYGESERGVQPERNSVVPAEVLLSFRTGVFGWSQSSPGSHRRAKYTPPGKLNVAEHLHLP